MGTPAWKAASDLADGYLTLNAVSLRKYEGHELDALQKEIERLSRDLRGQVVPQEDTEAIQQKSRKLLRLSQATAVIQGWRVRMRR
jgi:predicted Zn-dependent peptidase